MVVGPRLLLLDEPLSNLDPSLRNELRRAVRSLQQRTGITTLFVTHDQAEAVAIADRIAVMMDGRIKQVGKPQEFFENPADAQIARFFGSNNFLKGIKQGDIVHTVIGELEIGQTAVADGPVLLAIRPEVIEIGEDAHNSFAAHIRSHRYGRPMSRCLLSVAGVQLEMITSPYQQFGVGQPITVHLPKNHIQVWTV
jgi:ABC-type Fe3+/spermidine/putrescine transport system ATPase subunit